jgi:hypothetical protein
MYNLYLSFLQTSNGKVTVTCSKKHHLEDGDVVTISTRSNVFAKGTVEIKTDKIFSMAIAHFDESDCDTNTTYLVKLVYRKHQIAWKYVSNNYLLKS